jgi:hypothetical protein
LRNITQIGAGREEDRRRELGKEVRREVVVEIETRQIPVLLAFDFIDVVL